MANFMYPSLNIRAVVLACGLAVATSVLAQSGYAPVASEYAIVGALSGDQVFPQLGLNANGGYIVWQDNITDGDGWGISARRLDGTFSQVFSNFRVNQQGVGDQENPQVSLLNGGGAAFVWQGGRQGFQRIYTRFLSASNTWATGDILVNTFTNDYQVNPAITTLTNGNVLAAWSSYNEVATGSLQDVFVRLLSPTGQAVSGEILVNQFTKNNQRSATVAALSSGGFVVVWVSEGERVDSTLGTSVDIYARRFNASGLAQGGEFLVNTSSNVCANPDVATAPDGSFAVAWSEQDATSPRTNSWDVYVRTFSSAAVGGTVQRVNTHLYGDQFAPKITYSGGNYLEVWTSLGQDGSREGVYGRFLTPAGTSLGGEFLVNTTTASQQIHPAVAGDGTGSFLVAWTSFVGGGNSFDLYAQRYASTQQPLPAPSAPIVTALSATNLMLSWPALAGFSVADYEIYADGALVGSPTATVTNNWWTMNGLANGSSHSFQLDYVLTDGRRSPLSLATSGTTYLYPFSWGGIPYDWMIQFYGNDTGSWPPAAQPINAGGPTLLYVFLSGGNPLNPSTWLRTQLQPTAQGLFLSWNPQPGLIYQVQTSPSIGPWTNLGPARFAAGTTDAIYVGGSSRGYYRVLRVR
jgi:hypothetical protein